MAEGISGPAEVVVARSETELRKNSDLVWDSGHVSSDESAHCDYRGPALLSAQRYYWHVRVWAGGGVASDWSETAYWEMGLLKPSDWQANWIEPNLPEDPKKPQAGP